MEKTVSRRKAAETGTPKFAEPFVNGYKAIETAVVKEYSTIENKCVETLFKKKDETVQQAKARLKRHRL